MIKFHLTVTKQSAEDNPGRRWYDKGATYDKRNAIGRAVELSGRYHTARIKGIDTDSLELKFHQSYQGGEMVKDFLS